MTRLPDPPRANGLPGIGNTWRLLRDPLEFTLECARAYGDMVDLNVPVLPMYLVSRPDLIEQVLVTENKSYIKDKSTHSLNVVLGNGLLTSEGDFWRRQRRLAQPGFHRERVAAYSAVMVEHTERMLDGWQHGEVRDAHADMMRLTSGIAAETLFSTNIASEAERIREAFEALMERFLEAPPGVPLLDRLPTAGKRRFDRAVRTLDDIIYRIIAERRASGRDTGDLLSMLVFAEDEGGERMSDRQIRDEIMTLFLAGHETTALALSWSWLLLSRNPAAGEALARELNDVLGDRPPTVADLPRLRYAEWVIHESMRLYPPAWAIGREALEDCEVGGYRVPKGMQLWIGQYILHRDPRYFKDPEAFLPERWDGDFAKRIPRYAYFPFGGGPRLCIGSAFAMMEAVLLLASIARRYRLNVVPGHPICLAAAVTLRPKYGVRVTLERR